MSGSDLAESFRLLLVLICSGALGLYAGRRQVRSESAVAVAKSITQLQAQNVELKAKVAQLETENAELRAEMKQLRAGYDQAMEANHVQRCEMEKLTDQMKGLDDLLRSSRTQADDWRAAALRRSASGS